MNGMEMARCLYEQQGREVLSRAFPELVDRMAIGLAGEGSECFGFDDVISRDHDWGSGFCIWLTQADFHKYGRAVQEVYDSLSPRQLGLPERVNTPQAGKRVGCLCMESWYFRYTGGTEGPFSLQDWRNVPEAFLATAANGTVFFDPLGRFTAIRERLLQGYPEDVRNKKLAARAAVMAQAGQYNFPRCRRRGDGVAAQLALSEFMRAAMSAAYLLNRRFAPFYKWMHRGLAELTVLPQLSDQLASLAAAEGDMQGTIEDICINTAAELRRQGLSRQTGSFLLNHCGDIMSHITDPQLRSAHIMEE